jgi:adenylosuccinate synthase
MRHKGNKEFEKQPKSKGLVEFIEKEIGTPITMVSNGPRREEIIFRNL